MNTNQKFLIMLALIITLLVSATVCTWFLGRNRARIARSEPYRAMCANLKSRVKAWWGMAAILILSFLAGPMATLCVFGVSSLMAFREYASAARLRAEDHRALATVFFVFLPLQYLCIALRWYGIFLVAIPIYGFLLVPLFSISRPRTDQFLERTAQIQWGMMLTIYCISHCPALILLPVAGRPSPLLLVYLVFVTQMNDVLQYVFGKLFGRTPLAPSISPNKTWEGFIGGGLTTVLLGTVLWWITPFTPIQSTWFAALIVLAGTAGGLVLSAAKRSFGMKDWGNQIAGHGGMLDRFDSLAFSGPLFFHIVRFFFVT